MLTSRTITVEPQQHRVMADSGRTNHCLNRVGIDGPLYALPMISVDGQQFATLPQQPSKGVPTMHVFNFGEDGRQCILQHQFVSPTGKVIFGFGSANPAVPQADLAYEYRGQAWWYQRKNALAFNLAPWEPPPTTNSTAYADILASAFPGMTRDGRIIYAATWKRCERSRCIPESGYVVADPYQSNAYKNHLASSLPSTAAARPCITLADVAHERSAFAAFHGDVLSK